MLVILLINFRSVKPFVDCFVCLIVSVSFGVFHQDIEVTLEIRKDIQIVGHCFHTLDRSWTKRGEITIDVIDLVVPLMNLPFSSIRWHEAVQLLD
jgi:hypothetical protein